MRKEAFALLIIVTVLSSAIASATADVAYVYRKSFKIDDNVLDVFQDFGLTVDLIEADTLPIDFSPYRMIYVGDENFRNPTRIPVNDKPTVIANYYHADFWGLTDNEGVSQLASDDPLSVLVNNRPVQVYTQAREYVGGPAISYYFLDMENRAPGLQTVALTETTSSGSNFGDVISYAEPGTQLINGRTQRSKLCFYGIIESDYWTSSARQLFEECVGFVADACVVDSDCPDSTFSDRFCMDGDVYQTETYYTCERNSLGECVPQTRDVLVEECAFDCQAGSCVGQCEQDSDCGTNGYITPPICSDKDIVRDYETFTCENPGTADSFCSSEVTTGVVETCQDACVNGQCEDIICYQNSDCDDSDSQTEDTCHNPGTIDSFCTNDPIRCFVDSDCGTDGFITQPMCDGLDILRDFESFTCENPGTADSFCSSDTTTQVVQTCADLCVAGECQGVTCYEDSDCDDQNPLTIDQCNNPGTTVSECVNTEINCAQDSDCGASGFIGQEFCSANNVVKTYREAICQQPGTLDSNCKITEENRIVNECSSICVDGSCQGSTCSQDSDCNDANPLTKDECINPNSVISECRNTPINCAQDTDCGPTGYLGEEFCSSELSVSKVYQSATCENAGETNSACVIEATPLVVNYCDFACTDGTCIRCNTNSDCDDSNSQTQDVCVNPGETTSYCTNTGNPDPEIACNQDSDCGEPSTISPLFCSEDDVSQLLQVWTCNSPGETDSYCSTNLEIETLATCPDYCSDGECVSIECFNHQDCDDSDDLTVDICNEAGTPDSFCTNTPREIVCSKDTDCGQSGFIGDPFCYYEDSAKLFQEFECNLPDTPESFCSVSVEQRIIDECSFGCTDGLCLPEQGECTPGEIRSCGSNVGQCTAGVQFCVLSGSWTEECYGSTDPVDEICDGLDNDCDGQTDEGNVCGPTCTDECVLDERICSGDGYKLCGNYDSDPCTEWSWVDPCETGEVCSDGYCIPDTPSCEDECSTPGSKACSNNGVITCGNYDSDSCLDWSQPVSCAAGEVCSNGECILSCTDECSPSGLNQCFDNGFKTCGNYDSDSCLEWSTKTQCAANEQCQSGSCVDVGECTPGDTRPCGTSNVGQCSYGTETCSSSGHWGSCVGAINPTTEICDGLDNDCDGSTDEGNVCGPTCTNECSLGSRRCSANNAQYCGDFDTDSCFEWGTIDTCSSNEICDAGFCEPKPPTCSDECSYDGQRTCSGDGYKICRNYDSDPCLEWSTVKICSANQQCQSGSCVPLPTSCSDECPYDGARTCSGDGYKICRNYDADPCLEWSTVKICSANQQCQSGSCVSL
jgi:hypothetical protein